VQRPDPENPGNELKPEFIKLIDGGKYCSEIRKGGSSTPEEMSESRGGMIAFI